MHHEALAVDFQGQPFGLILLWPIADQDWFPVHYERLDVSVRTGVLESLLNGVVVVVSRAEVVVECLLDSVDPSFSDTVAAFRGVVGGADGLGRSTETLDAILVVFVDGGSRFSTFWLDGLLCRGCCALHLDIRLLFLDIRLLFLGLRLLLLDLRLFLLDLSLLFLDFGFLLFDLSLLFLGACACLCGFLNIHIRLDGLYTCFLLSL